MANKYLYTYTTCYKYKMPMVTVALERLLNIVL